MAAAMKREANPIRGPMAMGPRLGDLVHRLRLYVPPSFPDEVEEDELGDSVGDGMDERGKVVPQMGLADSAAVVPRPERFCPQRAAVLVCLFEGELGDLRVILTKRSSKLSTHSGFARSCSLLFLSFHSIVSGKNVKELCERLDFSGKVVAIFAFGTQVRCRCRGERQKRATRMIERRR